MSRTSHISPFSSSIDQVFLSMARRAASEPESTIPHNSKNPSRISSFVSLYTPKLSIFYLLSLIVILLILFYIHCLHAPSTSSYQMQKSFITPPLVDKNCSRKLKSMASKLRESVTFLPLKDLRYSSKPLQGHTWFMSSMHDTHEKGEVQYQEFPSKASKGRLLCLKGADKHDGSWNSYALAWAQALPPNATLMKGLTFVSYNHYNYDNIWHGLSSVVPFVAWSIRNKCLNLPKRWVLYHWGELRTTMGPWLSSLMEATFGSPLNIEEFDGIGDGNESTSSPACFEKAVVMRHNEGGMSREKRVEVYDLLRCKARVYCNVSLRGRIGEFDEKGFPVIGLTMFMRTGPRSFKNESTVIGIFDRACRKVEGCRLMVAYANNLSFCEQVKLMSLTDILVSQHGAQLTNMFLMDRNSSVMEFFPKGWLKLAGIGQYVYHWIASWSGMNHRGAWRDTGGDTCRFPENDRRCMSVYKNARIGYNDTYFSEWAKNVLNDVIMLRKAQEMSNKDRIINVSSFSCGC
ncbi:hypothetical protein BUALT_Bualt15G0064000 [Buddleja alternifolia]|uniref:Glycosyltransferase 61 catalytic domain-containing protein n=1 Tax=Buddleja alternifolia TaxID=168488 RepID=A0AAV6WJP7_9LAMI|nr:hypothetical protein BUALT_Bualt15G0064000 [Buddleja alternifolia]